MAVAKTGCLGIVLFQLGGPDTLEAIRPFLFNLFCDPDIIDLPCAQAARKPLAKLISAARANKVQRRYAAIGGGSPIRRHTEQQASALEKKIRESGLDVRCFVAMRYWHPFTAEAVDQVRATGCDRLVLLPLYPQYSSTTTGSSLNEWQRLFHEDIPVYRILAFYENELYLQAVVERINETLARFPDPAGAELVFSAHSVPVGVIDKGDPYRRQIEHTVELVMSRGKWSNHHRLCYQSKVGANRWLQPSLHTTLQALASEKASAVCIVPISFVSDHLETLAEINVEARREAEALGIERFEVTAGLNSSPTFIDALAEVVQNALRLPESTTAAQGRNDVSAGVVMAAD